MQQVVQTVSMARPEIGGGEHRNNAALAGALDCEKPRGVRTSGIGNRLAAVWIGICLLGIIAALVMCGCQIHAGFAGQLVHEVLCLHIPLATNTFVAGAVAFVAGIMFLWDHSSRWDDLGLAAAKVAVVLCTAVLLTGLLWTRCARGEWWSWTPHQTFSLLLWALYVIYLLLQVIRPSQTRAAVCAVYGVIAFLDVPLVYMSANLMPDSHSAAISMAGPLKVSLLVWFVPVTMITIGLIVARYRLSRRQRSLTGAMPISRQGATRAMAQGGRAT
jgi:heme exporter protein C